MSARPRYSELPDGRSWSYFGPDDTLGCLNLLTEERLADAARLVRRGQILSLNGGLGSWPDPSPAGRAVRPAPAHHVYELVDGLVVDDYLDGLYLQGGSQWDGFLHVIDGTGASYNGRRDQSIGMGAWGARGIAGRGVLLDIPRWAESVGRAFDWRSRTEITAADLEACRAAQNVRIDEGTILLVRVGWEEGYARLSPAERIAHSPAPGEPRSPVPGLAPSEDVAALLWDWGVAAIACDNPSLEATPYAVPLQESLHVRLLAWLGMPIGEYWLLDALAEACRRDNDYEFLIASAPLNLPGGVGSTANAIALR